jgi:serine/threonine protein kinase
VTLSSAPVREGDILASKYRVERVLGQGGMGIVVSARHVQLGFPVAVKFMLPEALNNAQLAERFVREARAAGALRSEHVARSMDFGTLENGSPYIVMEFLEGKDLDQLLDEQGRIAVAEAVAYTLQVCKAMDEAHSQGVIHRDLKPQNLFRTHRPDGTPLIKVLDFGISKVSGPDPQSMSMTSSSAILGSPNYMSPEQARSSKSVDGRADIYSLGVVLYQLITGVKPIKADSFGELLEAIFSGIPPAPPSSVCSDVPPALDAVVLRCLRKEPAERYQTVADLVTALLPFANVQTPPVTLSSSSSFRAPRIPGDDKLATNPTVHEVTNDTSSAVSASRVLERAPNQMVVPLLVGVAGAVVVFSVVAGFLFHRSATVLPATAAVTSAAPVASPVTSTPQVVAPAAALPAPPGIASADAPAVTASAAPPTKTSTTRVTAHVAPPPSVTASAVKAPPSPPPHKPPTAGAFDNPE